MSTKTILLSSCKTPSLLFPLKLCPLHLHLFFLLCQMSACFQNSVCPLNVIPNASLFLLNKNKNNKKLSHNVVFTIIYFSIVALIHTHADTGFASTITFNKLCKWWLDFLGVLHPHQYWIEEKYGCVPNKKEIYNLIG